MKRPSLFLAMIVLLALAMPGFAGVGQGLSGPHYNLNIIGVSRDKTVPDMQDSGRHTIFVPLTTEGTVPRDVKIYFKTGEVFQVLDGNATDDGRALIQVPYQYCDDLGAGCTDLLSYDVYAVGLGKPHGYAIVEAECAWDDVTYGVCTETLLMNNFEIRRTNNNSNKPRVENITDVFRATGCLDVNQSGVCDTGDVEFADMWIFNIPQLAEYFWDYDNYGLKLMQVRFYPTTSGSIQTVR